MSVVKTYYELQQKFKHLTLTIWKGLEEPYSKRLPSPICEKKVNESSLQNAVNAPRTQLGLLNIIVMVNQGGKTRVKIWTSCDADICHGKDGWAATTTVCPFQILLLLPFQLLLQVAKLMVIGCQPRPPDGGQAAIFETLEEKFLNNIFQLMLAPKERGLDSLARCKPEPYWGCHLGWEVLSGQLGNHPGTGLSSPLFGSKS